MISMPKKYSHWNYTGILRENVFYAFEIAIKVKITYTSSIKQSWLGNYTESTTRFILLSLKVLQRDLDESYNVLVNDSWML